MKADFQRFGKDKIACVRIVPWPGALCAVWKKNHSGRVSLFWQTRPFW